MDRNINKIYEFISDISLNIYIYIYIYIECIYTYILKNYK